MRFIYNIGISTANLALRCVALFNEKLKKGVKGRKSTFNVLETHLGPKDKTLWFHCASLGEYEQGLPVFQALRQHYNNHKIVLSFFSPSGYEVRKNTPIADIVVYVPLDSSKNAKRFFDIVNPDLTVFVKYDIWPNFLNELKRRKLRAILISALFRKQQAYFKFYGTPLKQALFAFEHIFTQDEISKSLLHKIGYRKVTVSGDTRFDRVTNQLKIDNTLDFIETFKNNSLCLVAGSTWPEGDALLVNYINTVPSKVLKFIIAPHDIKPEYLKQMQKNIQAESVLYSEKNNKNLSESKVFIIDTVGLLSKIYHYADIAYVGGGLGKTGLHNTLEPAIFGVPIITGPRHDGFPEAKAMQDLGGLFTVSNTSDFSAILNQLFNNKYFRLQSGSKNLKFIQENRGAVLKIKGYLNI